MGIPNAGQTPEPGQSTFSEDVLKIELCGPAKQHLSVIDVPGIFRTPTPGVTTKEDMALVRRIVHSYIKNTRTIILAVIPAPTDIATQEILSMAEEVDPDGQRTLGVLTKPDLVDKGGEENVMDLVRGRKNQLQLGYCIVRNRGQQEIASSSSDRHQREAAFFMSEPWASLDKDRVGTPALRERLRELLVDLTRREFPVVRSEIEKRLSTSERELALLGPNRETREQQLTFLVGLANTFQKTTDAALDAYYARHQCFDDNPSLRLATIVRQLNEEFSKKVSKKGHVVEFQGISSSCESKSKPRKKNKLRRLVPREPPLTDVSNSNFVDEKTLAKAFNQYPELLEVPGTESECLERRQDDILTWIAEEYQRSRGFELGTVGPSIVNNLWKTQSRNWKSLATNYINAVIVVVHTFIRQLLVVVCPDERVHSNLVLLMMERIQNGYRRAISHVKFILQVEKSGALITMNPKFDESINKAQRNQPRNAGYDYEEVDIKIDPGNSSSREADTVKGIHDILCAYYQVAKERFVDTVCMQGGDYHLVTGSDSPLRVFSADWVTGLTKEQLDFVAGEEMTSRRKRHTLKQEIEALKRGKKLLSM